VPLLIRRHFAFPPHLSPLDFICNFFNSTVDESMRAELQLSCVRATSQMIANKFEVRDSAQKCASKEGENVRSRSAIGCERESHSTRG
jgi:hypothetical protein